MLEVTSFMRKMEPGCRIGSVKVAIFISVVPGEDVSSDLKEGKGRAGSLWQSYWAQGAVRPLCRRLRPGEEGVMKSKACRFIILLPFTELCNWLRFVLGASTMSS